MPKIICFLILLNSMLVHGQTFGRLFANADKVVITPPLGTEMVEPRGTLATGVHDELYARAMVLSDGRTKVAIVTLDLIGLDFKLVDRIQKAVFSKTGIPATHLMLSCSHTHNAPITVELGPSMSNRNRQWESAMVEKVAKLVSSTQKKLFPVNLAVGKDRVQIGLNRRVSQFYRARMVPNPAGPMADHTFVLSLQNNAKDHLAVLYNYPAHPVAVHSTSTELSADYPGYATSALHERLGQQTIAMFAQACGGNINVQPLQGGFEKAEQAGQLLAIAVNKAITESETIEADCIHIANKEIYLPFHAVSDETAHAMQLRLQESMKTLKERGGNKAQLKEQEDLIHWTHRLHRKSKDPELGQGIPFHIQAFALGKEFVILAMTHEVFVEYQLAIELASPFKYTMVLAYSNGCASYVPTAEAFFFGGYEVFGAQQRYTMPYLKPDSEDKIKDACDELLNTLFEKIELSNQGG
ncbi:hypothetical protein GF406_07210 [candidate division KSB1 bacterium]|nr:hypothetical protein [candidate division KSB1 bacterium]